MSPILLRPIREQFEHNRVIRLLQTRLRRRYLIAVNMEDERDATGVRSGTGLVYPDLVLTSTTGARRLHGVVEVETAESVNHLEAMAEWVHFGKVRGAFYLYVPAGATDIARRLCEAYSIAVTEIWSYHAIGDQMRFTMTHRSARAASRAAATARHAREADAHTAKAAKRVAGRARRTDASRSKQGTGAKRSSKPVTRASKSTKRVAKSVGRSAKTTGTAATTAKKSVAKATSAARKTVTGATRRASSGGKTSARTNTSAAQSRTRSTVARTKKTAVPRQIRKKR